AMRRHDPDAAGRRYLHDAARRENELGALVMMARDPVSGGEILRHRRDRSGDLLVVLRVRALSEHRPANVDSADGPDRKYILGGPSAPGKRRKSLIRTNQVSYGSALRRWGRINRQLMNKDRDKNVI